MSRFASAVRVVLAAVLLWTSAPAAGKEPEKRRDKPKPQTQRVESTGKFAFTRLERAQKALADGKPNEALSALNELQAKLSSLSDDEKAMMWQTFAYAYSAQERYGPAAEAFEKCLALNVLPPASVLNARYNLAQLYLVQENYGKAIENFEIWFKSAENPNADAFYMMAAAYAQADRPREALPYAMKAVAKAPAPKEAWLQLVLSLQFQLKQHRDAAETLQKLIALFPKKTYWMQLAAAYTEIEDLKRALATMELAESQGFLTSENELRNLIQLYLLNDIPFRAAQAIERAIANGRLSNDAKNQELLANTWLQARDRDRAIAPLERAAELSGDGNLYVRLGQVHVSEERWDAARSALSKALKKGGLRDTGNVHLMLGIANASEERWADAERAFRAARQYDQSAKAAAQWLDHIAEELTLADYEKDLENAARDRRSKESAAGEAGPS